MANPQGGPSGLRTTRIGLEANGSPGVAVAAASQMQSLAFALHPNAIITQARPMGFKRLVGTDLENVDAGGGYSGGYSYIDSNYIFEGMFGHASPSAVAGTTGAYRRIYQENTTDVDDFATLTAVIGNSQRAQRYTYVVPVSMDIDLKRTAQCTMSGNLIGQGFTDPFVVTDARAASHRETITLPVGTTGGHWTYTFGGQTTASLLYNISASALQTAIQALSSVGPGNMLVGGSNVAGWSLVAAGSLGSQPLTVGTAASVDLAPSSTAPTVVEVTHGAARSPLLLPRAPVLGREVTIFMDTNPALIGTSPILVPYTAKFSMANKRKPSPALNAAYPSWPETIEEYGLATLDLLLKADDVGWGFYTQLLNAGRVYMSVFAQGAVIGAGPARRIVEIRFAAEVSKEPVDGDSDGAYAVPVQLVPVDDAIVGGIWAQTVCELATL